MAPYFDAAQESDRALLPPDQRAHKDLPLAAAVAEAAVIGYFTDNPPYYLYTTVMDYIQAPGFVGNSFGYLTPAEIGMGEDISAPATGGVVASLRVYLTGYKQDASSVLVDPNLKAALRLTVAMVASWKLKQWTDIEQGVQSSSDSAPGQSKSFRPTAEDMFPPDWSVLLVPYDARPVAWGL